MSATAGGIVLAGRILFSWFFINAGYDHVKNRERMAAHARQAGLPVPVLVGWPTGVWLLAAAVSIDLGVWPDVGSLMIGAFAVLAALYFHRYWTLDDPAQRQAHRSSFFRNLAYLGASLLLFAFFALVGDKLRFAETSALFSL